jgi:hypothetical protein
MKSSGSKKGYSFPKALIMREGSSVIIPFTATALLNGQTSATDENWLKRGKLASVEQFTKVNGC